MSENKKVFFIINKFSGSGYRQSLEDRIISYCKSVGIVPAIEFTRERGHATELAGTAVAMGFQKIFAVGGDGTVNEVARALVKTSAALGIIPKGSGNGLARHLHIPISLPESLSIVNSSRTITMDALSINDQLSFNVSGIGFDGHVAGEFGKNGKRGLAGYARIVLTEFNSFREFSGQMTIDGNQKPVTGFIVAIANASQFGNNARIAPLASVQDGHLDVCIIQKTSMFKAVGLVNKMFKGTIADSKLVAQHVGKHVTLELDRSVRYHIDGEPFGASTNFNIQIQPGILRVIIPEINSQQF